MKGVITLKKIIAFLLVIVFIFSFCVGCSNDTPMADEMVKPEVSAPVEDTSSENTSSEDNSKDKFEIKDEMSSKEEEVLVKEVKNAEDVCEYMNFFFENVEFKVMHQMNDYFDEYFNLNVQEYAYISGVNEDGFEVFGITVAFVDNRLADFSVAINIQNKFDIYDYQDTMNTVTSLVGYNYGMTKVEVAEIMEQFYDFNAYSDNEYGNQQIAFSVSEITCVSVVFEGGKDFEYDGTTYYYILSAIG